MACRQFFSNCEKCGKLILMTQNQQNKMWIPCDPELYRFTPSGGPETYVTPEGNIIRGKRDRFGQYGYRKHKKGCIAGDECSIQD